MLNSALPDYRENSKRKQDQEEEKEERARKVAKMLPGQGRRTQFHAVPVSERAFDENGNRLPWGLEGPEYGQPTPSRRIIRG